MIKIIITVNNLIMLHSTLGYFGNPSSYIDKAFYHTNTRSFFSIVEKCYHIINETTQDILSG